MSEELLTIEASWPGTKIGGEPGIVSGILSVSRAAGGEFLLDLAVGPYGAPPEDREYVQFPLSRDQAQQLAEALTSSVDR